MPKVVPVFSGIAVMVLLTVLGGTLIRLAASESQADSVTSSSMGTAFTYQGYLTDSQGPANGRFDLSFSLHDTPEDGNQVGTTITRTVTITEGLLSLDLDFGNVFVGTALWLEIGLRPAGDTGPYTPLLPRQRLAPTPLAVFASSVPWTGLTGIPAGFGDDVDDDILATLGCASGQIPEWNGNTWTCGEDNVGTGADGWSLTGNVSTTADTNFLGTTDNEPLELHINGDRALRLEPNATSPNVLGGYSSNSAGVDVHGATISGGGRDLAINQVSASFGTVGGGAGNMTAGYAAAVGGGEGNSANNSYSLVGGGLSNAASADYATVGGGENNAAAGTHATIAGGGLNEARAAYATVGGGANNVVSDTYATISGGQENEATGAYASVGGGRYNNVGAAYGTVAGGGPADPNNPTTTNSQVYDEYGTVGGGGGNAAGSDDGDATNARAATVGGGQENIAAGEYATTGGGDRNTASGYANTIGGGQSNSTINSWATIAGGMSNSASGDYASVAGGKSNTAGQRSATVAGGENNTAGGVFSTVGGGLGNVVTATSGTIAGGAQNYVGGSYGFAAGQQARAEHTGAFVWSDSSGAFTSTAPDQFLIDASGGVGIGTDEPSQTLTVQGSGVFLGGEAPVARGYYTSSWRLLESPSAVHAAGSEVYVTSYSTNTLAVFDASDPNNLVYVGHSTSNLSGPSDVFVSGQRAYVTSQLNNRLVVFDLSNPSAPDSLGSTDESLTNPLALYVAGKYAYVASSGSLEQGAKDGLAVFDISDPRHIRLTDFASTNLQGTTDVFVAGNYAYVTSGSNNRLVIFDVSDPRAGQIQAEGFITGPFDRPRAVYVSGQYAYIVAENSNELVILDVSDPNNIGLVGSISTNLSAPRDIFIANDLAYVASSGNDRLAIFDVSDPANIVALGFADTGADSKPVSLFAVGKHVYVASETADKLSVFEVNHLESPTLQIGNLQTAYLDVIDNAAINNDLAVHGGLQVGQGGALIDGALSVTGPDDSHILGALSIGGAGTLISDTVLLTRTLWVTAPTHALDVIGEGRFRVNDYHNLVLRSANAGSDEDAYIDLIRSDQMMVMTPTARIEFDAADPFTHSTSIHFHTRGPNDPTMISRLQVSEEGHLLPDREDHYTLGDENFRWLSVHAQQGVISTSDGRYKDNISDLPYGLAEVAALRPVAFNWIGSPDDGLHYGLIAQEVREVLPDVVTGDDGEIGTLGMNYSELVPVLVKAIQEQQDDIDTQNERIAALEARLVALEYDRIGPVGPTGALKLLPVFGFGGLIVGGVLMAGTRRNGNHS